MTQITCSSIRCETKRDYFAESCLLYTVTATFEILRRTMCLEIKDKLWSVYRVSKINQTCDYKSLKHSEAAKKPVDSIQSLKR